MISGVHLTSLRTPTAEAILVRPPCQPPRPSLSGFLCFPSHPTSVTQLTAPHTALRLTPLSPHPYLSAPPCPAGVRQVRLRHPSGRPVIEGEPLSVKEGDLWAFYASRSPHETKEVRMGGTRPAPHARPAERWGAHGGGLMARRLLHYGGVLIIFPLHDGVELPKGMKRGRSVAIRL
jgi:hypothetical protein